MNCPIRAPTSHPDADRDIGAATPTATLAPGLPTL
jgi:hypothetical protein